ncbi:hypothetical protein J2I47_08445 [Fibrella sp. HMF5335]|uniref:YCII-related domain-containing protein n=1 Tax=Fibrella rubiginis TaxID=2817060 RepID=A0A939GG16_9BACT|nr:YciI family protein [Fibrella rubiginis]MBO0936569.1 hypothetical protein [Fibrella rubiginis]
MQYLVHAYDHTDADALSRRMAVRADHLAGAARLKAGGQFILGGALLSPDGQMIGSVMLLDFETEAQLRDWQANEPYIQRGVWDKIDIKPFREAVV